MLRHKPTIQAQAAMVVDLTKNVILYAKHPDRRRPIASITKLMTAMIVIDSRRSMLRPLRVTASDVDRLKWSKSRLPVHSLLLRRTLLHIALMSSENRAAFALSRAYPGERAGFLKAMNRKAKQLRMTRSHFVDPTGLSPHNVSTARDVVRMATAAFKYRLIRRYTTSHQQLVLGGQGPLMYRNTDPLVWYKKWRVVMQKTGFTNEAGYCLVVLAPIHGHLILTVLLGDPNARAHVQDAVDLHTWLMKALA